MRASCSLLATETVALRKLIGMTINRDGELLDIHAEDFLARVIQHEVDHLEGKVFLDRLPNLKTLTYLREYEKYWQSPTKDKRSFLNK